ncbi:unnamed protein product [Calypogeia fissa]
MGAIPAQANAVHNFLQHFPSRLQSPNNSRCASQDFFCGVLWKNATPEGCNSISISISDRKSRREYHRWGKFKLRSTAASDRGDSIMLKNSIAQVEKMRASAIKEELTKLGISYADCFEKQELVVRLATARLNNKNRKTSNSDEGKTYKTLTQIPIRRLRNTANSPKNYILIPLKINSKGPFNFILDTGSTVTLVQPTVVTYNLQLTPTPAQQSLALFGGGLSDQKVMSIDFSEVELGNHSMKNVSALLMDQNMLQGWDPSIAGLLGLNILSQFDVEFDFKRELLVFHAPGAANRKECDVQYMEKLETSDVMLGILGVKVALGSAPPETALLDLGSSLCVATPDVARLAGVPENIISNKNPALGGGGIGQLTTMQFSSGNIDIRMVTAKGKIGTAGNANFAIRGAQFAIGEVPALRAAGCRILLGVNLFRNIRMIFSQSTRSVYMERPTS